MSRIGKKPILVPSGVTVTIEGKTVRVKGPKGELALAVNPLVEVTLVDAEGGREIRISVGQPDDVDVRALWGTTRANLMNLITGVTKGYAKGLEINGVGYRVNVSGKKLVFNLGFSHDVEFMLPEGVTAQVEKNMITVSGVDKQLVGETAARIRKLKPPEPYLGKGIKYTDEVVRRKAGKAATKATE